MSRYRCEEMRSPAGVPGVRLEDAAAGVDAVVLPRFGADWAAFGARGSYGERIELMHRAVDFERAGGSPVLFPVVGRTRGGGLEGWYRRGGSVYPMPIHGFAKDRPWEVVAQDADDVGAFVTCALRDSAETRAVYPYAFRLALTYRLCEGALRIEAAVENPGDEPLPFHLGYHPYFRAPVLPGGDRDRCLLGVPSRAIWELADLCATGRRVLLAPADGYDPARPLAGAELDQVFADLRPDPADGLAACRLRDPDSGWGAELRFDPAQFPVFVVYAPAGDRFVCLEPWTGLPGGLGEDTAAGQTARCLAPGARFEAAVLARPIRPATSTDGSRH